MGEGEGSSSDSGLETASTAAGSPTGRHTELARGATIDRYLIIGPLGAGGMGVVYTAYDPELDRKVAIKFLHPELAEKDESAQARGRLLREARALARVAHPNVVTVYDANAVDEQVFLVMELVDGRTLRMWLAESERSWREVLAAYVQAGRGLAAAHAAGLVHRDFKPSNVLVGTEGRARVLDFGLARAHRVHPSSRPPPRADSIAALRVAEPALADATRPGAFKGTPAYMAPEQLRGETADASTDQYGFAIALYEALYGERPFEGETVDALLAAMTAGRVREAPRSTRVPPWVRTVLVRALAAARADRYPAMTDLLAALEHDPGAARRRALAWVGGAFALASLLGLVYAVARRHVSRPLCDAETAPLAGVWDAAAKEAIRAAFDASRSASAASVFDRVVPMLDTYAEKLRAAEGDACAASAKRPGDAMTGFRMACVDRKRMAMKALTAVFAHADDSIVSRAIDAVYALPNTDECRDETSLRAAVGLPDDPMKRAGVVAVRAELADAESLLVSGKPREASPVAQAALEAARAIPHGGSEAEALLTLGRVRERTGDYAEAIHLEQQCVTVAERSGADELFIRCAARVGFVLADKLSRFDEADSMLALADAARGRIGPDPDLEAEVAQSIAIADQARGHPKDALPLLEKVLAIRQRSLPPEHPTLQVARNNLGYVNQLLGNFDTAFAIHQGVHDADGKKEGTDIAFALDLINLGSSAIGLGHYPEAVSYLDEGVRRARDRNPQSFWIGWGRTYSSLAHALLGDAQAAADDAHAGLTIAQAQGNTPRLIIPLQVDLGTALLALGKPSDALTACQRALDVVDPRLLAPDALYEWDSLACIGLAQLALHRPQDALPPLERSVTLTERVRAGDLAMARFALAQTLVAIPRPDPTRARQLAEEAQTELTTVPWRSRDLDAVTRWLRSRR